MQTKISTPVAEVFDAVYNPSKITLIVFEWASAEGGYNTYQNCEGWTQMSACLKAWLEHGINLRSNYY